MTDEFSRASSKVRRAACLVALALVACVDERPPLEGTTSLEVTVLEPTDLGTAEARLPDGAREVRVRVRALDAQGDVDASVDGPVAIYRHFLGTLTPTRGSLRGPELVTLVDGVGEVTLDLGTAYGATTLWIEDAERDGASFAAGASPPLWFRDPYLAEVSRPEDEARTTAFERSPLEGKQIEVTASEHGADGKLVVTGVYSQGYTVSDVDCSVSPCVAGAYAHLYIFTFGRPRAEDGRPIEVGQTVDAVLGGVSEFNGLTEVNFPQTFLTEDAPDLTLVPDPAVLAPAWIAGTGANIELERLESGLVAVDGATVCPLDDNFTMYGQWKLDVGNGCDGGCYNVISRETAPDFDPADLVGMPLARVVGTLRAVNIGSFHVWILQPRDAADVQIVL